MCLLVSCDKDETNSPVVEDFEGNKYETVQIGNQLWMAENIQTQYDAFGNKITRYAYQGIEEKAVEFGGLYNYEVAKKICPQGWHLPSVNDWNELELYLGMAPELAEIFGFRGEHAGALKEGGQSGFNALFGGYKDGTILFEGQYFDMGVYAAFWLDVQISEYEALSVFLHQSSDRVGVLPYDFSSGLSVRCVED